MAGNLWISLGVVFSYLNMPAWMCPCSEKFSLVKSMLWLILWGCGITALKPPPWGPEITSHIQGWSLLTTFLWPGSLHGKCGLPSDCLFILFWPLCSVINEEMGQPCVLSKLSWQFMAQSQIWHSPAGSPPPPLSFLRLYLSSAFSENVLQTLSFLLPPSQKCSFPNPSPPPLFQKHSWLPLCSSSWPYWCADW